MGLGVVQGLRREAIVLAGEGCEDWRRQVRVLWVYRGVVACLAHVREHALPSLFLKVLARLELYVSDVAACLLLIQGVRCHVHLNVEHAFRHLR